MQTDPMRQLEVLGIYEKLTERENLCFFASLYKKGLMPTNCLKAWVCYMMLINVYQNFQRESTVERKPASETRKMRLLKKSGKCFTE